MLWTISKSVFFNMHGATFALEPFMTSSSQPDTIFASTCSIVSIWAPQQFTLLHTPHNFSFIGHRSFLRRYMAHLDHYWREICWFGINCALFLQWFWIEFWFALCFTSVSDCFYWKSLYFYLFSVFFVSTTKFCIGFSIVLDCSASFPCVLQ